jgi:hypothetical protein
MSLSCGVCGVWEGLTLFPHAPFHFIAFLEPQRRSHSLSLLTLFKKSKFNGTIRLYHWGSAVNKIAGS